MSGLEILSPVRWKAFTYAMPEHDRKKMFSSGFLRSLIKAHDQQ
jgi:hypothetical protein